MVDGVSLDDPQWRWRLLRATVLPGVGAVRVSELELPSLDGVIIDRQGFGPGVVSVSLLVPEAGVSGGKPVEPVDVRLNRLQALLARARVLTRTPEGRPAASVEVIRVAISEPSRVGRARWQVDATLTVQPFWAEDAVLLPTQKTGIPGSVVFSDWLGATGDVVDGVIRVKGPLTRCAIVNPVNGSGVSFISSLSASQYVFVDTRAFQGWRATSAAQWEPSATPVPLDWPPVGRIRLTPADVGLPLSVGGEGLTAASAITVRGKRWWL